jgi:hypothetical protein
MGADFPYTNFIEENVWIRRQGWQTDTGEDSVLPEKHCSCFATVCSGMLISGERVDTRLTARGISFSAVEIRFRIDADNSDWTTGCRDYGRRRACRSFFASRGGFFGSECGCACCQAQGECQADRGYQ